jgi:nicotinic acid phosphoribosyltransferase
MYPECEKMVAYGEFRRGYEKDTKDTRFVYYGIRHIMENYVAIPWTVEDVEMADKFYMHHNAGFTPYPFPKDLFLKFVNENNGYFPVKIESLKEGTVANVRVPCFQITAEAEYSRLVTFLETILTQVWYPATVATLSRRAHALIEQAFDKSVDEDAQFLVDSRLHDFGFRGCTSVEQSVVGGCAHLLNFTGSDTMSACFHAQFRLNNGKPVGTSIPATEHSVMTSWPSEEDAIRNMITHFGGDNAVFAVVMDSYDYVKALYEVIPKVKDQHEARGGLMVLRPDSGDPVECILQGLDAGEKTFGATVNSKGYKVVNRVSVIQGDGISISTIDRILNAAMAKGYSAQCVAFGMGGGLLQKVNRDTMSFATKLSYLIDSTGEVREIMKRPKTDGGKISFPGILKVVRVKGQPTVFPAEAEVEGENLLELIYDHGPLRNGTAKTDADTDKMWDNFDTLRARVAEEWNVVNKDYNPISTQLREKIEKWMADHIHL